MFFKTIDLVYFMKNITYSKRGFLKQACETVKYTGAVSIASAVLLLPGCISDSLIPYNSKEWSISFSKNAPAVAVEKNPSEKSIDSICDSEQAPSVLDNSVEKPDIQIPLVPEYVPDVDDSPVDDYTTVEPIKEAVSNYSPQLDSVKPALCESDSLPSIEKTLVLNEPSVKNDSLNNAPVQNNYSADLIVSGNNENSDGYWMAKKSDVNSYEKGNSENIPSTKTPFDFGTTVALSALASLGSSFFLKYLLAKKSSSLIASIKEAYSFIKSLPELSKQGITEESVRDFIQRYSPNTSTLAAHFAAKTFMDALPDSNQFSKLELMVFANTVKNHYSCDDAEFCTGIYRIVENYNRTVMEFDDLQKTVVDFNTKKGYSRFSAVADIISKNLVQLNAQSKQQGLFNYKKEYRACISRAETAIKQNNYSSAINHFKEALVFNKQRSEAYLGLSELYQKQNFLVDAAETLDDFIASSPCKPILSKAYVARASCFVEIGNANAALSDVRRADNSQLEKYVLEDRCHSMLNDNSIKKKAVNLLKRGYFCYVRPALFYLESRFVQVRPSVASASKAGIFLSDEAYAKLHPVEIYDQFKKNPDLLSDSQKTRFINRLYGDISIMIKNHSNTKKVSKEILDLFQGQQKNVSDTIRLIGEYSDLVQKNQNTCQNTLDLVKESIDLVERCIGRMDDAQKTPFSSQKIGFVAN